MSQLINIVPQRSLADIKTAMEVDAQACAANHKSSQLFGLGPSFETELEKCRGQVQQSYAAELNAAQAYEFNIKKTEDTAYVNKLTGGSFTKQQMIIAALVLLVVGAIVIIN